MIIKLKCYKRTEEENYFVNDLIRARIFDIEKTEEIDTFISEGIFDDLMDLYNVYDNDEKFLPCCCNDSYLVKNQMERFDT